MKIVIVFVLVLGFACSQAYADNTSTVKTKEQIEQEIKSYLSDDLVEASKGLNQNVDYISNNYSEAQIRQTIKNYELLHKKAAKKQGKDYVPYDKQIDVNNPKDVKRFLKKRTDIIF